MEYIEREVIQTLNYLHNTRLELVMKSAESPGVILDCQPSVSESSADGDPVTPNPKATSKEMDSPDTSPNNEITSPSLTSTQHKKRKSELEPEEIRSNQKKGRKAYDQSSSDHRTGTVNRGQRRRWYDTYEGALAFALFKVKTWMMDGDGCLNVSLEHKKYGGSVYDWDILYLGMKMLYSEVIEYTCGIHAARTILKVRTPVNISFHFCLCAQMFSTSSSI